MDRREISLLCEVGVPIAVLSEFSFDESLSNEKI